MTGGTRRAAPAAAAPRPRRRVLVVEDEADVAHLLRYHLGRDGDEVEAAADGIEALRRAREGWPDVVLLDVMAPGLNGWEICRRLKQDPETASIAVIMLTGRTEEGDKILGLEVGADDDVTRPFSPREVLARIRAVTRRGGRDAVDRQAVVKVGPLEIDRDRLEARMAGTPAPGIESVRGVGYRFRGPERSVTRS